MNTPRALTSAAHRGSHLALALTFTAFMLVVFAQPASAQVSFCPAGSAAGECKGPEGVAVDPVSGNVYVADRINNRIDVFDEAGGFLFAFGWGVDTGAAQLEKCTTASGCQAGLSGTGAGQFKAPRRIEIDRDPASPSYRHPYVFDSENLRVQKFDREGNFLRAWGWDVVIGGGTGFEICESPAVCKDGQKVEFGEEASGAGQFASSADAIAVGPGGTVYVADSTSSGGGSFKGRIERFDPDGNFLGSSQLLDGNNNIYYLAVDSTGDAYVSRGNPTGGDIEKYELTEPNATPLDPIEAENPTGFATDAADHLFVAEKDASNPSYEIITEYDPGGAVVSRFGYALLGLGGENNLPGLALAKGEDRLVVSATNPTVFGGNQVALISLPPSGPVACCAEADPVGNTKANLKAGVNPEGKASTYHFEYVEESVCEADVGELGQGHCFDHATATPESAPVGSDFTLHAASAEVGCADPSEEPPPPDCLTPETKYRFRVVATNADGENKAEGSFETAPPLEIEALFSTDVGTDAAQLHATVDPLGIAASGYFEYVSDAAFKASGLAGATRIPSVAQGPLDFGSEGAQSRTVQLTGLVPGTLYHYRLLVTNSLIEAPVEAKTTFTTFPLLGGPHNHCPNASFRSGASAFLPDCRAYEMVSPVDKNGGDIAVLTNGREYRAGLEQSAAGGERFSYSSATSFGGAPSAPYTSQYLATRIAGKAWASEAISPPRSSASIAEAAAKFDVQYKDFAADLSSGWLLHDTDPVLEPCAVPGYLNLYRRDTASGDWEALTTVKPPSPAKPTAYWPEAQGASADGAHAVFRADGKLTKNASSATISGNPIEQLYEHVDTGKGCGALRLVSVLPNGLASDRNSAVGTRNGDSIGEGRVNSFARAVSSDGSRIVWSAAAAATGKGPGALYVRVDGKETLEISAGPARYWTAAVDGSKVFYTLGETADSSKPLGKGELFEYDLEKALAKEAATTPVATGVSGVVGASADGARLYFVSNEALGGEGKAGEHNLYLREGGATKLIAVLESADVCCGDFEKGFTVSSPEPDRRGVRLTPDGSQLAFAARAPLTDYDNHDAADGTRALELYLYDAPSGQLHCVSCNPSGARPAGREFALSLGKTLRVSAQLAPSQNQFHAPHNLSEDGNRLFFESFEALLPRDTNGAADVYEWERAGSQEACEAIGAELYVPAAAGCLSLISTGKSPSDAIFSDASADGDDVFFKTGQSLLGQDPGQLDLYDARVNGGLPKPSPPEPGCEGEACQGIPSLPTAQTPASSAFQGAGNVSEATRRRRCRKGKVRRRGRCVSRKSHKRAQRARHERRAKR